MVAMNVWDDDLNLLGKKAWGRKFGHDPQLDCDEYGRLIFPPSWILTDVELQNPEPPSRRERNQIKLISDIRL